MNASNIIITLYRLYTKIPYILTFMFVILSIYHFIKKDDENFINSLIAIGFGILSILSYLICFKLIIPNMTSLDPSNIFYSLYVFIGDLVLIIANLILVPFISLGIVDFEKTIGDRLKYAYMPVIFLTGFFVMEKICSMLLSA